MLFKAMGVEEITKGANAGRDEKPGAQEHFYARSKGE